MKIPKSAVKVGTVEFKLDGNRSDIFFSVNRNTGESILWERDLRTDRTVQFTGRRCDAVLVELNKALNEGEAVWVERNDALGAAKFEFTDPDGMTHVSGLEFRDRY